MDVRFDPKINQLCKKRRKGTNLTFHEKKTNHLLKIKEMKQQFIAK